MDSYLVKTCTDCGEAFEALDRLNKTLSKYAKNRYQTSQYLLKKAFPKDRIKLLIWYKDALENLTWDSNYYQPSFSADTIISRVKILTNGL
jgi:hypothetical protein